MSDKRFKKNPRYTYLPPVRVSDKEKLRVKERALKLGITVSEYQRRCIRMEMGLTDED